MIVSVTRSSMVLLAKGLEKSALAIAFSGVSLFARFDTEVVRRQQLQPLT